MGNEAHILRLRGLRREAGIQLNAGLLSKRVSSGKPSQGGRPSIHLRNRPGRDMHFVCGTLLEFLTICLSVLRFMKMSLIFSLGSVELIVELAGPRIRKSAYT